MNVENKVRVSQLLNEHDNLSEIFLDQFIQLLGSFEEGYPIFSNIQEVVNKMVQERLKEIEKELEPL